jgi:hypothetical protein
MSGLDKTGAAEYQGKRRESDVLLGFVEEVQEVRRRLLGSTISDVPGRTADVKEVALLRLQQAADAMAEEAVALERSGE